MLWNPLEIARLSKSCRQKTISEKRKCLVLWCVYSYRCPYCCKEERCVVLLGRGGCWCRLFGTADCCQKTRSTETGTYENIFLPPLNFSVPSERGVRRRVWKHFCAGSMFLGPLRTRSTETGTYENIFLSSQIFSVPSECGVRRQVCMKAFFCRLKFSRSPPNAEYGDRYVWKHFCAGSMFLGPLRTRSTEAGTYENIFLSSQIFSVPSECGVRRQVRMKTFLCRLYVSQSLTNAEYGGRYIWTHFSVVSNFLGPLRMRSTETGTYENSFVPALMFLGPLRFSSSAFLSLQFLWIIPIVFYFCFCFPVFWFIFVACTCYLVEMSSAVPVRLPSQTVVC